MYIAKCDSSVAVKQHAALVWKSVIYNTPSTIRDTLPVIMDKLFTGLVQTDEGQKAQVCWLVGCWVECAAANVLSYGVGGSGWAMFGGDRRKAR